MKLKMALAVSALLTIGLSSAAAYADSVTFTLTNENTSLPATGGSVTYDATISAPSTNSAAVYLNGDSFNITSPITLDDTDFFSDPTTFLAPGQSVTEAIFVLTMPPYPTTPFGTYDGTFTLLGGANGSSNDTLGTVNFSLTAYTPEPSSIVLLLTGMAGLAMTLLRARFKGDLRGGAR